MMSRRGAVRSRTAHSGEHGRHDCAHRPAHRRLPLLLLIALALLGAAPARAQHRVPNGWEEGLFDVVATGLPQSSVTVLVAPLDSDDVYVDGTSVFIVANRLAELIEGTIDVDVGTLSIEIRRESGFPA